MELALLLLTVQFPQLALVLFLLMLIAQLQQLVLAQQLLSMLLFPRLVQLLAISSSGLMAEP